MDREYTLSLPNKDEVIEIKTTTSIVVVGANGAGKTRLGSWIEQQTNYDTHRVSAQKSLSMPDTVTPMDLARAESQLLNGNADDARNKQAYRWANNPESGLLSDFDALMVYLFSDNTEESMQYMTASKASKDRIPPPITKLDKVKDIWERILPHRELLISGLSIKTKVRGSQQATYKSSKMSDGERVVFYLIGQSLAAPANGIVIMDEPELHLHKSIQAPLWREIEKLRPDCLFVYLTHDVDFAAALHDSMKIWLKSFDGSSWDWEIIGEVQGLPEDLLIELIGSRKPIIFTEGTSGSFDTSLYSLLFKNFLVIPRGSCHEVIQAVKAFTNNPQLHHLSIFGVIDRDRRDSIEIEKLLKHKIYCLDVAEVENLFCTEEIINYVSTQLMRNPADDFKECSEHIFQNLQGELDKQISLRTSADVQYRLNSLDGKSKNLLEIQDAYGKLISGIDIAEIYSDNKKLLDSLIATKNYKELLKYYNRKSLASQISKYFGLENGGLQDFVLRLCKTEKVSTVRSLLKPYFGLFNVYIEV